MSLTQGIKLWCLCLTMAGAGSLQAQSTLTYTVDPDFSTGEMLRTGGAVEDIVPLDDGGYLLGGGILTMFTNPSSPFPYGSGMITGNGGLHPDWEIWGNSGMIRELHEYQGGYIYSVEIGQVIDKMTYTGLNWYGTYGEVWADYFKLSNASYTNPYEVEWAWDVYILEDEKVLIAGAIATDTLQPWLFRHLTRVNPDGTHDDTFPIVEAMPQTPSTHISKIERAGDGSWYVSGNFEGVSGHISPHIAKLDENFEVDTAFVSPLAFVSVSSNLLHTELKYMDDQERLWIGGKTVQLQDEPDEQYHLVRLLPNGELDPAFSHAKVSSEAWSFGWEQPPGVRRIFKNSFGHYFVTGSFSHYNDTAQPCITAIDDSGILQNNYFQGDGPSMNFFDPDIETYIKRPSVDEVLFLENGDLLIGGAFSDFMGAERYGMLRLNPGTLSAHEASAPDVLLYPNPAKTEVRWDILVEEVKVYDVRGVQVLHEQGMAHSQTLNVSGLLPGMYFVRLFIDKGNTIEKLVIQ